MEGEQELQETPACALGSALVSLAPFSPPKTHYPRRISGNFIHPNRPILSPRQPAWLSLQGRLIGAAEATSAKAIGNGWSRGETVAWELFSPMHRVLIVSVVAAAAADLKKTHQIFQLRRSVELRDQVLSSMQQKLDDLCEQMNTIKDQAETGADRLLLAKSIDEYDATDLCSYGCHIHKLNKESTIVSPTLNLSVESKKCASEKEANQDEMFKVTNMNIEPEERRMSDLSDWCSSVTSSVDIQLNTQALEQDICNLQKECEEKDAAIKELAAIAHATDIAGSKRISELEEIIRRKNMIISKLKKDMMVLEQKILHLTRLRRPSFSASASDSNNRQLPVMAQNLLYDMDSSTSPSSSDSDCPMEVEERQDPVSHKNQVAPSQHDLAQRKTQTPPLAKAPTSFPRSTNRHLKQQPVSPLKENNMNQGAEALAVALKPRQLASSVSDVKRNGRHVQSSSKDAAPQRRWV